MNDSQFMLRAIQLASNGAGLVVPNPKVGAVIVKNGEIIAEGWHTKYGAPHAEVEAINHAGIDDFSDCSIYVNLEPCSHFGKTPPCAEMLIEKKFAKVVIGMTDPNPIVSGRGIAKLRDAGIDVVTDVCLEESEWLNRIFIKSITGNQPYILLKIAQTIDGFIALKNGQSKWISSEESRRRSHLLRNEFDAVIIGRKTTLKDNPLLTVRDVVGRDPLRVICDTNLKLPLELALFKLDDNSRTIVCCNEESSKTRKARNLCLAGVNILPIETDIDGRLSINDIVKSLRENFEITSLMVEGGADLYSSFVKAGLADEIQIFIAPKLFGDGISAFNSININRISDFYGFKLKSIGLSDIDIHAIYVK